jgi:large subunit ribosomal protein L13
MDYIIDAKKKPLGRIASEAATILQGKKSVRYQPNAVSVDRAIIKNYREFVVTGGKETKKIYYRHTGYMGHLKETTYEQAFAKDPKKVLRVAVRRMLPKNFLNHKRIKHLIFSEEK